MSELENMQKYRDTFIATLVLLLSELYKNGKKNVCENSKKLLDAIISKTVTTENEGNIIKKVYITLSSNVNLLKNKDIKIFKLKKKKNNKQVKITVIPAIDIGASWNLLDFETQEKIWLYMKALYINSTRMINNVNNLNNVNNVHNLNNVNNVHNSSDDVNNMVDDFLSDYNEDTLLSNFWKSYPDTSIIIKKEFNPYVGVGTTNENYGVVQMISGPDVLPDQVQPGIGGVVQMFGVDKMLNMAELSEHLKNLSPDEIEKATTSIKSMLGNVDEGTSQMIDMMLNDISSELKKEDSISGNPMDNIVKIAETVAKGLMPKIDHNKIDMRNVWNQTKDMANKCQDKDGNPLFQGGGNPLSLLTGFMEKQMNLHQTKNTKSSPTTETPNILEADYEKECHKMLKEMGLPNIPSDMLKNMPIEQLLGDLYKTNTKQKKSNNAKSK